MMRLPFSNQIVLSALREIKRPATLADVIRRIAKWHTELTQDVILNATQFFLEAGIKNASILLQEKKYVLSEKHKKISLPEVNRNQPQLTEILTRIFNGGVSEEHEQEFFEELDDSLEIYFQ